MNPHKKQPARVKARVLYVDNLPRKSSDAPPICTTQDALTPNAISVLPRDDATQAAMVRQGARAGADAYYEHTGAVKLGERTSEIIARAVLASFGLLEGKA